MAGPFDLGTVVVRSALQVDRRTAQVNPILTTRPGDANLRRVAVTLPRTELSDTRHVRNVCAPGQFAVRRCPAASAVGYLRVWTPLLDRPLAAAGARNSPRGCGKLAVLKGPCEAVIP